MMWDRVAREIIEIVPGRTDADRRVRYSPQWSGPVAGKRLQPIRWRAALLSVALVPWAVAAFFTLAVCIQRIGIANNVLQFNLPDDLEALRANDGEFGTTVTLQSITILFAAIFFIRWLYQARANSDALGLYRSRWGRSWLSLAWIIPGINFWGPLRIVSDLWRGSDPSLPRDRWPRPALVVTWWIAWLTYYLGSAWESNTKATGPEVAGQIRTLAFFEIAATSIGIIAAALASTVVWRISLLQHSYRMSATRPAQSSSAAASQGRPGVPKGTGSGAV